MKQVFFVFLGGGLGSLLRFVLSKHLNPFFKHFYLGTFLSNILGCLIIGVLLGLMVKHKLFSESQMLLLVTGFCGGFTTFSTFAFENYTLLRSGEMLHFFLYMFLSLCTGLMAVALGVWATKFI